MVGIGGTGHQDAVWAYMGFVCAWVRQPTHFSLRKTLPGKVPRETVLHECPLFVFSGQLRPKREKLKGNLEKLNEKSPQFMEHSRI
jgi:hypothetical protein